MLGMPQVSRVRGAAFHPRQIGQLPPGSHAMRGASLSADMILDTAEIEVSLGVYFKSKEVPPGMQFVPAWARVKRQPNHTVHRPAQHVALLVAQADFEGQSELAR